MIVLWIVLYLEGERCLSVEKKLPMAWLDRQFAQAHRLVLLEAEVLPVVEVKMVLAVSGLLVKRGRFHVNRRHWRRRRRWCCLLAFCLWLGALGAFSLDLVGLGGIGTCPGTSGLCQFASLLIQQQKFYKNRCYMILIRIYAKKTEVTDEVPIAVDVSWKDFVCIERNQYKLRKSKIYLESLCQGSSSNRWRCLCPSGGDLLETHVPGH